MALKPSTPCVLDQRRTQWDYLRCYEGKQTIIMTEKLSALSHWDRFQKKETRRHMRCRRCVCIERWILFSLSLYFKNELFCFLYKYTIISVFFINTTYWSLEEPVIKTVVIWNNGEFLISIGSCCFSERTAFIFHLRLL